MATIDVNLGSSDQTIDGTNASDGDVLNVTALGTQTLTIDGVSVSIANVADIQAAAAPTFNITGGGTLSFDEQLLAAGALNNVTYNIYDNSALNLSTPTVGAGILSNTTVNFFGPAGGMLTIDNDILVGGGSVAPVPITVGGFGYNDSIGFTGSGATFQSFTQTSETGGVLTFTAPATVGTTTFNVTLTDTDPRVITDLVNNGASFFQNGVFEPVCFLRGTMIATPRGEVPIEALEAGDTVIGGSGERTVAWIGRRLLWSARIPEAYRATNVPVRVLAGALGENSPSRDLLVSPGHHLLLDGKLVKASALLNGETIVQDASVARIEYFHLELDRFDTVIADGAPSESWADGGNRDFFQNVDVTTLQPHQCARRLADRPGFALMTDPAEIAALRERLADRAEAIRADAEPLALSA